MHLGSSGRIRRLLPHQRMNSPRKESLLPFVYALAVSMKLHFGSSYDI